MNKTEDKPKKKVDLGTIAFAKVNKLEKRVLELEEIVWKQGIPLKT